jgi:hypothetical protein
MRASLPMQAGTVVQSAAVNLMKEASCKLQRPASWIKSKQIGELNCLSEQQQIQSAGPCAFSLKTTNPIGRKGQTYRSQPARLIKDLWRDREIERGVKSRESTSSQSGDTCQRWRRQQAGVLDANGSTGRFLTLRRSWFSSIEQFLLHECWDAVGRFPGHFGEEAIRSSGGGVSAGDWSG